MASASCQCSTINYRTKNADLTKCSSLFLVNSTCRASGKGKDEEALSSTPFIYTQQRRALSTRAQETSPNKPFSAVRNLVKPFLLKCHPDVQPTDFAKQVNLKAIQNLNSYLDSIQSLLSRNTPRQREPEQRIIEVDFIMMLDAQDERPKLVRKRKQDRAEHQSSRRRVELQLPPKSLCQELLNNISDTSSRQRVEAHVSNELSKLLKVAGLAIPAALKDIQDAWEESLGFEERTDRHQHRGSEDNFTGQRSSRSSRGPKTQKKTPYERSRDRFTSRLDWSKFDKIYRQAVADMNADLATEGLIENDTQRRRKMIADLLSSNVRLEHDISLAEQLIVFRRLSLLLQDHFEDLHFDDFGNFWENMQILLTPVRQSALQKRQRREENDNGFSFTLHPNYKVTIHVPIDFRDDELIQELDKNLWDFYNLVSDGLEEQLHPDYEL